MTRERVTAPKVIGDLSIYPIGEGTSLGEYVRAASRAMGTVPGLRMVPGAMSTALEASDLATILTAVRKAHEALLEMGAKRITIALRIDHRLDKAETIEYKVGRIQGSG
jgi:uncharacterized protein (TIGR00106 family)